MNLIFYDREKPFWCSIRCSTVLSFFSPTSKCREIATARKLVFLKKILSDFHPRCQISSFQSYFIRFFFAKFHFDSSFIWKIINFWLIQVVPNLVILKISPIGIIILLNKALKNLFFCQSKSSIMDAANLQQKIFRFISNVWPEPDNQIKANSKTLGIKD